MKNSYNFVRIKTIKSFRRTKAAAEMMKAIARITKLVEHILLKLSVIIVQNFAG